MLAGNLSKSLGTDLQSYRMLVDHSLLVRLLYTWGYMLSISLLSISNIVCGLDYVCWVCHTVFGAEFSGSRHALMPGSPPVVPLCLFLRSGFAAWAASA